MPDKPQSKEEVTRNKEIARLKSLNQGLKNKSHSKSKDNLLEKPTGDSTLFGLFDIFRFG